MKTHMLCFYKITGKYKVLFVTKYIGIQVEHFGKVSRRVQGFSYGKSKLHYCPRSKL